MLIDKNELMERYNYYIDTSDSEVYESIWFTVNNFANFMLCKWCKKLQISIGNEELCELTTDCTIKVMDKVFHKEKINDFSGLLYYITSNCLRDRKTRLDKSNRNINFDYYLMIEGKVTKK